MPDDPAEAAEDRGVGAGDGAEGVGEAVEQLPVRRGVPSSAREPGSITAADAAVLIWMSVQRSG